MEDPSRLDVTQALLEWSRGNQAALGELMPFVYAELRAQARRSLRLERPDHTLQTTALVHEVYLKLVDQRSVQWQHRAQFFGATAHFMRRILVDHARQHGAAKRGGGVPTVVLTEEAAQAEPVRAEVIALDGALDRLAALSSRQARLVELRYFGGLSIEEAAQVLDVSIATAKRDWRLARAWLHSELDGPRR